MAQVKITSLTLTSDSHSHKRQANEQIGKHRRGLMDIDQIRHRVFIPTQSNLWMWLRSCVRTAAQQFSPFMWILKSGDCIEPIWIQSGGIGIGPSHSNYWNWSYLDLLRAEPTQPTLGPWDLRDLLENKKIFKPYKRSNADDRCLPQSTGSSSG